MMVLRKGCAVETQVVATAMGLEHTALRRHLGKLPPDIIAMTRSQTTRHHHRLGLHSVKSAHQTVRIVSSANLSAIRTDHSMWLQTL